MRSQSIAQFVANLTGSWFQPPRGMDPAAQAEQVAEMTKAVSRAIPLSLLPEQIEDALEGAKSVLLSSAKSRAWPIISEIVLAVKKSLPSAAATASDMDYRRRIEQRQIEIARDWWAKFGDLPSWLCHEHVLSALISDGIKARQMWKSGVDIPRHMRDWPEAAHWQGTPAFKRFGGMAAE
jgi:hypothetical protein